MDIKRVLENALEATMVLVFDCDTHSCRIGHPSGYETVLEFSGSGADRKLARLIQIDHGIGE